MSDDAHRADHIMISETLRHMSNNVIELQRAVNHISKEQVEQRATLANLTTNLAQLVGLLSLRE